MRGKWQSYTRLTSLNRFSDLLRTLERANLYFGQQYFQKFIAPWKPIPPHVLWQIKGCAFMRQGNLVQYANCVRHLIIQTGLHWNDALVYRFIAFFPYLALFALFLPHTRCLWLHCTYDGDDASADVRIISYLIVSSDEGLGPRQARSSQSWEPKLSSSYT